MFRRIAQMITPPPARPPEPGQPFVPPKNSEIDLAAAVKPPLMRLLLAPSVDHETAQESLDALKRIAGQRGLYVTAYEIRTLLDAMPREDAQGAALQKARGYVLSGDFFLVHMRRELEGFRRGTQSVGPNVFRGYSNEVVESLTRGTNVRRAVEMPVLIVDELLAMAAEAFDRAPLCLDLARQIMDSMVVLVTQRFERDTREWARGTAPPETPRTPFNTFDAAVVTYLETLETSLAHIQSRCIEYATELDRRGGVGMILASGSARQLEVARNIHAIAESAQYLPFAGWMKQRVAALLTPEQAEAAGEWWVAGGLDYETQGDREWKLVFNKLGPLRYRMAAELYEKAGDAEAVARVRAKAAQAASAGR